MKILLTYSSKTGNTKAVAEAVLKTLPQGTDFFAVSEVKDVNNYDAVIVGFWIDKGLPNEEALNFMETIKNKKRAISLHWEPIPILPMRKIVIKAQKIF